MELEAVITEQVKHTLKLADQTIPVDANLIEYGLHSLAVMQLVTHFQTEYEVELNYIDFVSSPTIQDWVSLLEEQTSASSGSSLPTPSSDKETTASTPSLSIDTLLPNIEKISDSPLSEMQYSFWAGQQSTDVSAHLYVELDGHNTDPDKLNQAIRLLLKIHPMLRAAISIHAEQSITEYDPAYQIPIDDWRDVDHKEASYLLANKRHRLAHQKMSIEDGQVVTFSLTQLPDDAYRLHIDVNMIAADAPSILLMYQDLASLYAGNYEAVKISQQSYFAYLQSIEQDEEYQQAIQQDQAWWRSRLADIAPPPSLPLITDKLRVDSYQCDSIHHLFNTQDKKTLQQIAHAYQVSPSTLMLGVFAITVGRWSSNNRFRLNIPTFKRKPYHEDVDHLVGDFTNLLIFSIELFENETFGTLLKRLEEERQLCMQHSTYSGINVLRDLSKLHEDTETAPIVYTCGLEYGEIISEQVRQTLGEPSWCVSQGPMVDLDVQVAEHKEGLLVNWDIRTAAFPKGVVEAMFAGYIDMIQTLLSTPTALEYPLSPAIPLTQRQYRLPYALTNNALLSKANTLHGLFWQQVKQQPHATALLLANKEVTYQELAQDTLTIAQYLSSQNLKQGDCIALALDDAYGTVAAMLAVLSLGGCYFVMANNREINTHENLTLCQCQFILSSQPKESLNDLLQESGQAKENNQVKVIEYATIFNANNTPEKGWLEKHLVTTEQLAYFVFDNEAKATPVTHQLAIKSLSSIMNALNLGHSMRLLSLHALHDKAAALDIFSTLSCGGTLALVDQIGNSTPEQWAEQVRQHNINVLHGPSLRLSTLIKQATAKSLTSVALVLSAGEQTPTRLYTAFKKHNKSAQLVALGGAKHAIHYTSFNVCDDNKAQHDTHLSYGKALPGIRYKVINELGQNCPDFVMGQLWLSGETISQNISLSTGEHLATHFDNKGVNWYNSGDFAYYMEGGDIQFCGSASRVFNHQGYKISLTEVAGLIAKVEGVLDVSLQQIEHQGEQNLLAAILVENSNLTQQPIQNTLAGVLPRPLLPRYCWLAESLPLDAYGDLDRKALLEQYLSNTSESQAMRQASPLEQAVSLIFAKTLGIDVTSIGLNDDFFDAGGDSLLATHLAASINQYFKGCGLTIVDVFVERTPASLAQKIHEKLPELAEKIAQVLLKVVRKQA